MKFILIKQLCTFTRFRNRLLYCYNKIECLVPVKVKIVKPRRKKRRKYNKKPLNPNRKNDIFAILAPYLSLEVFGYPPTKLWGAYYSSE